LFLVLGNSVGQAELAALLFADRWQCSYTCWKLKKSPPVPLIDCG